MPTWSTSRIRSAWTAPPRWTRRSTPSSPTRPTETLAAAKEAWLTARDDYGPTEAFRFYGGPIDNEENGVEGLMNAWPLDEAYIDYVEGSPDAGDHQLPDEYPTIDADLLVSLNEQGGEANISTGWHAIEFLLWGQDLSTDGAGARPVEDYTTAPNADRRAAYLSRGVGPPCSLTWARWSMPGPPTGDNYRTEFLALAPDEALGMIMTGMGELSRGELAGERMTVAYEARSQEDEHSCFSDNTTNDIIGNASGDRARCTWARSATSTGPGSTTWSPPTIRSWPTARPTRSRVSVALAEEIPPPFDQHLVEGVSDEDPGQGGDIRHDRQPRRPDRHDRRGRRRPRGGA